MNKKQEQAFEAIRKVINSEESASVRALSPEEWDEVLEAVIDECRERKSAL